MKNESNLKTKEKEKCWNKPTRVFQSLIGAKCNIITTQIKLPRDTSPRSGFCKPFCCSLWWWWIVTHLPLAAPIMEPSTEVGSSISKVDGYVVHVLDIFFKIIYIGGVEVW